MYEYGAARLVRAVSAALWAGTLLLTGCQRTPAAPAAPPASAPIPSYGATFLGPGDCAARGQAFREVPCTSERAVAQVSVRSEGARTAGAAGCPLNTDFVLYIGGDGASGYACMRNLEAPHPGDPGMGGGPFTVVGDCVYHAGADQVKETPCDGSGANPPEFKVTSAVPRRPDCPASTALYVELPGGGDGVGCARRL
ncbi:hypothetical protein ACFWBX_18825 [Streptomyces sp. NPDC059991]|uniref:hypothetical protein n=1 Tax=Streptomyces sp. NPDC059991 TaxID=3347028 RepID=UPI0036B43C82